MDYWGAKEYVGPALKLLGGGGGRYSNIIPLLLGIQSANVVFRSDYFTLCKCLVCMLSCAFLEIKYV